MTAPSGRKSTGATPLGARRALRTIEAADIDAGELAERKRVAGLRVSVGIPARNEASTVGEICSTIARTLIAGSGLVDELVVLDGASTDATAEAARAAGADVIDVEGLLPDLPSMPGKGEALWRSLAVLEGDIVVWIDADIRNFGPHFVTRLVAPLVEDDNLEFVKAFYRRPLTQGDGVQPEGGGRVTELLARPMLATLFPELAGFRQPLAGEYAGRRELLLRLPFFTGYSVEVGLLIDLLESVGVESMAQVDLDERIHRNRSIDELAPMAHAIAGTILRRAEEWGRIDLRVDPHLTGETAEFERPPMETLLPGYRSSARRKNSVL